ncbi:MarR family winged helix-turn-helix transcriptional regulator [Duganella violaceipulchra]|uniref:DNA-binding MarR family transcriptional regulator n=1 Tax=Duganella violaceipulchra TaxID=2849652 RepID=A0AA41HF09_9BURK|nr:MarR family winged helix-turn-helix transcriptional regulator [Duganella violaceicalia]MBV6323762.1 MarR family winged helix-turn-helix transcriptional regulator [Duganella violaceicalia]MCP2007452.1 DNA-binding MarR family transcriptional regulator [Duganella violaceicalia]
MSSTNPTENKIAGHAGAAELPSPTRVLRQFRVVFNAVKTHFRNVEKAAGIGGSQLWALSVVQQRPGIGVGELARALDVHQTTASNLLKSLAAQGLIALDRNGSDRRAATVTLLPAGEVRLGSAPGPFAGVLPDALATLDARTLVRMEHDLSILIAALEAGTAGADIPLADL